MIDYAPLVYRVEPMQPEDVAEVFEIEQVAFSAPWSARAYDYELHYNEMAHYFVARPQNGFAPMHRRAIDAIPGSRTSFLGRLLRRDQRVQTAPTVERGPVIGYGGLWLMLDEAHISTIASHPDWRGRGIGELLLLTMIDTAQEIGAETVTLEVRVSNTVAQNLYRKYAFQTVGRRKGYYSDNGEDAYIMSTPAITGIDFRRRIQELKAELFKRLAM